MCRELEAKPLFLKECFLMIKKQMSKYSHIPNCGLEMSKHASGYDVNYIVIIYTFKLKCCKDKCNGGRIKKKIWKKTLMNGRHYLNGEARNSTLGQSHLHVLIVTPI